MFLDLVLFRSARFFSSASKKRSNFNNPLDDNESDASLSRSSARLCPICRSAYDNHKHKRLIDTTCHHEKCYTCMFEYEQCSICLSHLGKYRQHTCHEVRKTKTQKKKKKKQKNINQHGRSSFSRGWFIPTDLPWEKQKKTSKDIPIDLLVHNRRLQASSHTRRSMSPSPPSPSTASSTIIANNLLVQASPPIGRTTPNDRPPATPVKPISHFQKLLHHFNGNKSLSSSFTRATPLTSSQSRSMMKTNGSMTTVLKNTHPRTTELHSPPRQHQPNEFLPPPPPPEMAHEQLLDMLMQGNRTRISSLSPSPSTSSAATHTSIQRLMINPKKQQHQPLQINPTSDSPSMSNSDLSFSPSALHLLSPSESTFAQPGSRREHHRCFSSGMDTFSGYELGPMSKSVPLSMAESQTWSSPRYITTPSSISPSNHTCPCGSSLKDDLHLQHDDSRLAIPRHWIYDEMLKLLKSTTKPGLVLLSRTPGMGKTWLMKNLLRSTSGAPSAMPSTSSIIQRNETNASRCLVIIEGHRSDFSFQLLSCALPRWRSPRTIGWSLTFSPRTSVIVLKQVLVPCRTSFTRSSIGHLNTLSCTPIETSFYASSTLEKPLHWTLAFKTSNTRSSPVIDASLLRPSPLFL